MCTYVRQNFWKVSSNSEHHSKPTMNINSQHHNLLGNQISPKSKDLCIWWPFYTLVTMAMVAILNFFNPLKAATYYGGYSYKVDHNMDINSQHQNLLGNQISSKSEDFCILAAIANQRWISIRNIIIYLETKFRPNRRILYFGSQFESP